MLDGVDEPDHCDVRQVVVVPVTRHVGHAPQDAGPQ
jgi:hypothetical protein